MGQRAIQLADRVAELEERLEAVEGGAGGGEASGSGAGAAASSPPPPPALPLDLKHLPDPPDPPLIRPMFPLLRFLADAFEPGDADFKERLLRAAEARARIDDRDPRRPGSGRQWALGEYNTLRWMLEHDEWDRAEQVVGALANEVL